MRKEKKSESFNGVEYDWEESNTIILGISIGGYSNENTKR